MTRHADPCEMHGHMVSQISGLCARCGVRMEPGILGRLDSLEENLAALTQAVGRLTGLVERHVGASGAHGRDG